MNEGEKLLKEVESIRMDIIDYLENNPTYFDESDKVLFAYNSETTRLVKLVDGLVYTEHTDYILDMLNIDELYQILYLVLYRKKELNNE